MEIEAFYTLDFKPAAGLRKSMNEAKSSPRARRSSSRGALPAPRRLASADVTAEEAGERPRSGKKVPAKVASRSRKR